MDFFYNIINIKNEIFVFKIITYFLKYLSDKLYYRNLYKIDIKIEKIIYSIY